jgi:hypothetical protein
MKKTLTSPRFQHLAIEGSWIVAGQIATVLGALTLVRVLTVRYQQTTNIHDIFMFKQLGA